MCLNSPFLGYELLTRQFYDVVEANQTPTHCVKLIIFLTHRYIKITLCLFFRHFLCLFFKHFFTYFFLFIFSIKLATELTRNCALNFCRSRCVFFTQQATPYNYYHHLKDLVLIFCLCYCTAC